MTPIFNAPSPWIQATNEPADEFNHITHSTDAADPSIYEAPPLGVNRALCFDPGRFPLDASWLDMHHDKGQLGRAPSPWFQRLLEKRLNDGETAAELALHCVLMSFSGQCAGYGHMALLAKSSPEALLPLIDPEAGRAFFGAWEQKFRQASLDWTPPVDMELRGWSKMRLDHEIQEGSREKFAWMSIFCRMAHALGLPETLRRSSMGELSALYTQFAKSPESTQKPHVSQASNLESAACTRPDMAHPPRWVHPILLANQSLTLLFMGFSSLGPGETWPGPMQHEELLALSCQGFSPKNFRANLALLCSSYLERARLGGRVVRRCLHATKTEFDKAISQQKALELLGRAKSTGSEPNCVEAAIAPSPEIPEQAPHDHQALLMSARDEVRSSRLRVDRSFDAMVHLAAWATSAKPDDLAGLYFESVLGHPLSDPQASASVSAVILLCPPVPKLASFALSLAQAARNACCPIDANPDACEAVWTSHLKAVEGIPAGCMPPHYGERHMLLALSYPHEAKERESLALAPGDALAKIEHFELDRTAHFQVDFQGWDGPPMDDDGEDSDGVDAPIPSTPRPRRMRL